MGVVGIQIQDGFIRQQPRPAEERSLCASRAERNSIPMKWPRMEVILDIPGEGQIVSRLKPVEPGYTIFTWGFSNDDWTEEGDVPPPGDEPAVDMPWQQVVDAYLGQNEQPPLETGDVINITERPVNQNATYGNADNSPFNGNILVLVVSPTALELTGRRQRVNPLTGDTETETVRYSLLDDRVLTVIDSRGNVVSGGEAIYNFPFFCDKLTRNTVNEGGKLRFFGYDPDNTTGLDAFPGQATNNLIDGVVVLGAMSGLADNPIVFDGNVVKESVTLDQIAREDPAAVTRYTTNTFNVAFAAPGDTSVPVELDQCLIDGTEAFNALAIDASMLVGGVFRFTKCALTPTSSTFYARKAVSSSNSQIDLYEFRWAGVVTLDITDPDPAVTYEITRVDNLPAGRPVILRRTAQMNVKFVHDPAHLFGYQGEDTVLHLGLDERVTLRYDAATFRTAIVYLEAFTPPIRGHVIVQEAADGTQTIFPRRRDLVLVGDGFQVEDDEDNDQTRVINLGGPGDGEPGPQGIEGRGYRATATTAAPVTIQASAAGTVVTFLVDAPFRSKVAYSAGARVRASAGAAFLEGVVQGYTEGTGALPVLIDLWDGGGAAAAWNLNLAGEPFLYGLGTVIYSAGKATLDLSTGEEFLVSLGTAGLGAAATVTLDYVGTTALRSIQVLVRQPATGSPKTLAYQAGKFLASNGTDVGAPTLRQLLNAEDAITGYFYRAHNTNPAAPKCTVLFAPNLQAL